MIIKSLKRLEIGVIYKGRICDMQGNPHNVNFMPLEEVTVEDYLKSVRDANGVVGYILKDDKFYRASID